MNDRGIPGIKGGYAPSHRKELDSDIWMMPPLYHRVWYWLRLTVQYDTYLFPTRRQFGIYVLPGQRLTSLQLIAEGVKWTEYGREVIPNKKSIKDILGWLESQEMVTIQSNEKGTLITLVNWHSYNSCANEKVTGQSNAEVTQHGHKEEREERKEVKPTYIVHHGQEFTLPEWFGKLWGAYPRKDGRKEAERHFNATIKTESDMRRINWALGKYLAHIVGKDPQYIKTGKVWFNNWHDWIPEEETDAA